MSLLLLYLILYGLTLSRVKNVILIRNIAEMIQKMPNQWVTTQERRIKINFMFNRSCGGINIRKCKTTIFS